MWVGESGVWVSVGTIPYSAVVVVVVMVPHQTVETVYGKRAKLFHTFLVELWEKYNNNYN